MRGIQELEPKSAVSLSKRHAGNSSESPILLTVPFHPPLKLKSVDWPTNIVARSILREGQFPSPLFYFGIRSTTIASILV